MIRGPIVPMLLACLPAMAQFSSPAGRWKTFDDATGKAKSIVVLYEQKDTIYGKIEKALDRPEPNPLCNHCVGDLRDKPLIGMQFLWNLKKDGDRWTGGRILDPGNGRFYKCTISLEDGGKKLKVRGFIGFSLLGRTQYWVREQGPQ